MSHPWKLALREIQAMRDTSHRDLNAILGDEGLEHHVRVLAVDRHCKTSCEKAAVTNEYRGRTSTPVPDFGSVGQCFPAVKPGEIVSLYAKDDPRTELVRSKM
ncbi:MAG: hypothetical protein NT069_10595 [Planctomycetota bacterium]|nr:hypothetical protein [Planctomycetota bacterium]